MKFIYLSIVGLLFSISMLSAQNISPKQIKWPLITGSGSPSVVGAICNSSNYAQSYQDISETPNVRYHCSTDGWELEFNITQSGIEYLRPTVDTNNPTLVGNITGTCSGIGFNEVAIGPLDAVYTGKSGNGPVGPSATQTITGLSTLPTYGGSYTSIIFSNWQPTTNTYNGLVLNVVAETSGGFGTGSWLAYSTDGGVTWNYDHINGGALFPTLTTRSFIITGATLSNLQVSICAEANGTLSSHNTTNTIEDVWTTGTYGGSVVKASLFQSSIIYSAALTPLPACSSSLVGSRAVVSDATIPTYMGTYASGGAITAEVICSYDGSSYAWKTN